MSIAQETLTACSIRARCIANSLVSVLLERAINHISGDHVDGCSDAYVQAME